MLERIRRHRHANTAITALFALLLLLAMLSGVRVRAAPVDPFGHDICSVGNAPTLSLPGEAPEADEHAGLHGPECVLCIALAPTSPFDADTHRPAAPAFHSPWRLATAPGASMAFGAPLPARGPPMLSVHA